MFAFFFPFFLYNSFSPPGDNYFFDPEDVIKFGSV